MVGAATVAMTEGSCFVEFMRILLGNIWTNMDIGEMVEISGIGFEADFIGQKGFDDIGFEWFSYVYIMEIHGDRTNRSTIDIKEFYIMEHQWNIVSLDQEILPYHI